MPQEGHRDELEAQRLPAQHCEGAAAPPTYRGVPPSRVALLALASLLLGAALAAALLAMSTSTQNNAHCGDDQVVRDIERTMLAEEIAKRTRTEERLRDCNERLSTAHEALAQPCAPETVGGSDGDGTPAPHNASGRPMLPGCNCRSGDLTCTLRCSAQ